MEKIHFSFRRFMIASGLILLITGLFVACKKDTGTPVNIPSAGLMAFNLVPDREAVGIALSGNLLTSEAIGYTGFNGLYQNIYTGSRDIDAYDYLRDSVFAKSNFNFEENVYYSVFVVGNNGVYKNVVAKDDIDSSASADKAYIRYVNAIPDSSSPVFTVTANGASVIDTSSKFTDVSSFTPVNGGEVNVAISNGNTISANRNITLENGKIYTALLIGVPGHTDSTKAVQIRYIVNGTVPAAQ